VKRLGRLVTSLAMAISLAAPGAAAAKVIAFKGSLPGTPTTLRFEVIAKHGNYKVIQDFRTKKLAVKCNLEGSQITSTEDPAGYPVHSDGRFERQSAGPGDQTIMKGRFVKAGKRARGVFKFDEFNGSDRCKSPKLKWRAHRL
jgi:hypothetical protein